MARHRLSALLTFLIPCVLLAALSGCAHKPRPDALTEVAAPITSPGWIKFRPEANVDARSFMSRYAASLQLSEGSEMRAVSEETDELGVQHLRYQQYYRGIEVEGAEFLVHAKDARALSANGRLAVRFAPEAPRPAIDEARAWAIARERMGASAYYDGAHLVEQMKNGPSDHVPRGVLVFTQTGTGEERALAWRFDAYIEPVARSRRLYVDAGSGAIIKETPLLPNCFTTNAATSFRGNQSFNTARANIPGLGERFILVDDCHGNQLRQQSFNFTSGNSKEVFDSDNDWSDQDRGLVTSFWALGVAYDYFDLVHKRKSYDNKNGNMVIVNDPNLGNNASGGGGAIVIGIAGPGSTDDYNTTDIVGHEFTHSLIETSAKLGYDTSTEAAALNESFSDILGEMTEAWEEQTPTPDWIIGADKGCAAPAVCRNLINPKMFSQPDTYKGNFWQSGAGVDPHVNGTVQNRWFTLMAAGGNGNNAEIGVPYNIAGIGTAKAQRIAYRTLTRYLVAGSDYVAARDGSIQSAVDLFGAGSAEEGAVTQAWCAVGLCPFTIPTLPDRFDRPGGNPNPSSPNNNNTESGATPVAAAEWAAGQRPTLSIANLNLFGVGDVDNFQITLPAVSMLGGACFPSGVAFSFPVPVDARILVAGRTVQSSHNLSYVKFGGTSGSFVLQVSSPFPSLILDYGIKAAFYQSIDPHCWQTEPPTVFEQIRLCPMCDVGLLTGQDEIILDPDYRRPDLIAPTQHYFRFRGGELDMPIEVARGNALQAELVDSNGRVVQRSEWKAGSASGPSIRASGLVEGIYSLRFSGYGNGTQIRVRAPGS
jgi:Zn-dependent metalloprotease